jgi:hypothetical protein
MEGLTRLRFVWSGDFKEGLRIWCENENTKGFRALPLIVVWGIWLARNALIFDDRIIPPL